jgi:tetratricopeptide (TPR) repeat protein
MFVPIHLSVDPDPAIISSLASPGLWTSLIVLLSLCGAVWTLRKTSPILATGTMLIVISPLSAYAVFPLADVVSEHRAYISTLGAIIIMAAVLGRSRYPVVFSCVVLGSYFWLTIDRNVIWHDEVTLWRDAAEKAPEKLRPHLNLGALYQVRGENQQAITEYEFVLKRAPKHDAALANLGSLYLALNQVEQAETILNRAITAETQFPNVYLNLAVVRLRQGRLEDARRLLQKTQALNPRQPMVHHNLGDIFFNERQTSQAIREYLAELQINPDSAITHLHLAIAYEANGSPGDALTHYLFLQRLDPASTDVQASIRRLQQ